MNISPLLIPIIALMIPFFAIGMGTWSKLKNRELDMRMKADKERSTIDFARVERLEDRVRVLERIVTDRGGDLAHEIERLRDAPLN